MKFIQQVLITALVLGFYQQADAAVKIGVVDMQKALRSVKRGKTAQAKLEKELGAEKTKLEKDQQTFQKDAQAFQQKAELLSEKARTEQGNALQKRMVDLQQRTQKFQMDAQRKQGEAIEPLIKGLREATTKVAAKRKMDLVIDDTGEAILYAEDKTDLTEEVIKAYDEKNP